MSNDAIEWVRVVGELLLSWPVVGLVAVLLFRRPLVRILGEVKSISKLGAGFGGLHFQLTTLAKEGRESVSAMNELETLMAESRLLELEIFMDAYGTLLTAGQRERMESHIRRLRQRTPAEEGQAERP